MQSINRQRSLKPVMSVEEAKEADYQFFSAHPDEKEYIREFVPGEFGKAELPEIPEGFRFATCVSVTLRVDGQPVGRYRRLMAVCEGQELHRLGLIG